MAAPKRRGAQKEVSESGAEGKDETVVRVFIMVSEGRNGKGRAGKWRIG